MDADRLVFVDETGASTWMTKALRAQRGQP
jgi:hypothetical protein